MATYSSILAWEIPRTEEPDGLCPKGCKESDTTEHIFTHTHTHAHTSNNNSETDTVEISLT